MSLGVKKPDRTELSSTNQLWALSNLNVIGHSTNQVLDTLSRSRMDKSGRAVLLPGHMPQAYTSGHEQVRLTTLLMVQSYGLLPSSKDRKIPQVTGSRHLETPQIYQYTSTQVRLLQTQLDVKHLTTITF
jgi:hypothetical protein